MKTKFWKSRILFIVALLFLGSVISSGNGLLTHFLLKDALASEERIPNKLHDNFEVIKEQLSQETLKVDDLNKVTIEKLIYELVGDNTEIRNIKYTGAKNASGFFEDGKKAGLDLDRGILLTTGDVKNALGPNNSSSKSTNNNKPGDPDLTALVNYKTYDASVLEFEFKAKSSSMSFEYIFASEEYNEFVGSQYNDVFAFFINGKNIALVPGTDDIVSVNTINLKKNADFYINNDPSKPQHNIQYDGFTKILPAVSNVYKDKWNTIKLAIADTSDHIYDSAIFIRSNTFSTSNQIVFETIGDQKVDEPFEVKVKVVNQFGHIQTNISGILSLQSMPFFSPNQFELKHGFGSSILTFYTAQNDVKIYASLFATDGNYYYGTSNTFNVASKLSLPSKLVVQVVDENNAPIEDATVSFLGVLSKQTDANGFVDFSSTPGLYFIQGTKPGYSTSYKYGFMMLGLTQDKLVLTKIAKRYVVFIPGVFGSKSSGVIIPHMPNDYAQSGDLKLHYKFLGSDKVGWDGLKNKLKKHYQIIEFPYDWRLYPPDKEIKYGDDKKSPTNELADTINSILVSSPGATIDLVGHSLGGLVILSYLQQYGMQNIEKIAFVGSPVKGTLNFYPIATEGDILASDQLVKPTGTDYFYSKTIDAMYEKDQNKSAIKKKGKKYEYAVDVSEIKTWLSNDKNTTLLKIGTPTFSDSIIENKKKVTKTNSALSNLYDKNTNPGIQLINNKNTRIFYATTEQKETIREFDYDEFKKNENKSDPKIISKTEHGDGLTIDESALFLDIPNISSTKELSGNVHSSLIEHFSGEITSFLNENRDLKVIAFPDEQAEPEDASDDLLNIYTHGFVSSKLSINDQHYGYDLTTNQSYYGANLTDFTRKDRYSALTVGNIAPGSFSVKITGEIPHDFILSVEGVFDGNEFYLNETAYFHGDPIILQFVLNPDGTIDLVSHPQKPANFQSQPYGLGQQLTRISWESVPEAVGYRLYTAKDGDPRSSLMADVDGTVTSYDTSDPWGGVSTYYRVTSVDGQGNESFLSHQVTNRHIQQYFVPKVKPISIPAINLLLSTDD